VSLDKDQSADKVLDQLFLLKELIDQSEDDGDFGTGRRSNEHDSLKISRWIVEDVAKILASGDETESLSLRVVCDVFVNSGPHTDIANVDCGVTVISKNVAGRPGQARVDEKRSYSIRL